MTDDELTEATLARCSTLGRCKAVGATNLQSWWWQLLDEATAAPS